jgi:predicted nucleic acid-binding protein
LVKVRARSIVLDAEALSALALGTSEMLRWAAWARQTSSMLHISTATLAEVITGIPRDAKLHRIVGVIERVDVTDEIGRRAGRMRTAATATRRKRRDLTIDALVASTAVALPKPALIITGDVHDLTRLVADEPGIAVEGINARI